MSIVNLLLGRAPATMGQHAPGDEGRMRSRCAGHGCEWEWAYDGYVRQCRHCDNQVIFE